MREVSSDEACLHVQSLVLAGEPANSQLPRTPETRVTHPSGAFRVSDLSYGDEYPNSHLDIWYPPGNKRKGGPVVIFLHGGGFLFGDKSNGDPLALSADPETSIFAEILAAGFCLVSADYALAPEYRHPVQIRQLDQVLAFLLDNSARFGLDMDNVVLMGGSAGANLVEMYGLALGNTTYAATVGVGPAIEPTRVKAVVIDEAALDVESYGDSDMNLLTRTWLGEEDIFSSPAALSVDVPSNIIGDYPPAFIITSNAEPWFPASAQKLRNALERHGLDYEYYEQCTDVEKLEHGFLNRLTTSPSARECMDRLLAFLKARSLD